MCMADKKVGVCIILSSDNFMTASENLSCSFGDDSAPSSHRGIAHNSVTPLLDAKLQIPNST